MEIHSSYITAFDNETLLPISIPAKRGNIVSRARYFICIHIKKLFDLLSIGASIECTYLVNKKIKYFFDILSTTSQRLSILGFIHENPGMSIREISYKMKIPKTTCTFHLNNLKEKQQIKTNSNSVKRFFIENISDDKIKLFVSLRTPTSRKIVLNLIENDKKTFQDLHEGITKSIDGGKTFSPAQMIDPQTGPDAPRGMLHSKTFDSMHVSEDGKVFVTWLDSRGKQNDAYTPVEVKTTWSDDGLKTFSKPVTVKTKVCQCCVTSTCTDSKGGVYVQYRNIIGNYGEPNYRDIVISASHDGGINWNTPELVADDGFEIDNCPHSTSTITTDSYGNLHSAWWTQGGQSPGTYYATSEDGGLTWTKPLFVEGDSEWFPATQIKIVMDSNENPVIVWTNRTVEGGAVKHTTIIDGQVTDIIELGNGDHAWSDSDGGVTALVWKANDGRILIKSWNDNA